MKTNKLTKVLIALDYDPTSKKVAEEGYSLAKTMGAEIVLLHVIADPVYYSSMEYSPVIGLAGEMNTSQFQLDSLEGMKNLSQHFLDKLKLHLEDKAIQTLVTEGDFAESILKTAKNIHADVIVMGSHSHKWLENILMGSVTEKVLHHTSLPLYIISTKKHS